MTMMFDQDLDSNRCRSCLETTSLTCDSCRLCLEHCCTCSVDVDPTDKMAGRSMKEKINRVPERHKWRALLKIKGKKSHPDEGGKMGESDRVLPPRHRVLGCMQIRLQ